MVTLSVKNISKKFGYLPVLEDISFTLKAGNCYLLSGANGQGKSTLLKVMATLYQYDSGSIFWKGLDIKNCLLDYQSQLFLLPHELSLYEEFSPLENLTFFTEIYAKKISPCQIIEVLSQLKLQNFTHLAIKNFSSGMKKKILLALLNLLQPQLLFLDEPYSSLDKLGIDFLNRSLENYIKSGAIILLVSHQQELASGLYNTTLRLRNNRLSISNE